MQRRQPNDERSAAAQAHLRAIDPITPQACDPRPGDKPCAAGEACVLIVSPNRSRRVRLAGELHGESIVFVHAQTESAAREALEDRHFDLVIVESALGRESVAAVLTLARAQAAGPEVIVLCPTPTIDQAVEAMRLGAGDLLDGRVLGAELRERVWSAIERSRERRKREQRVTRLRRMCKRLNATRQELSSQVGSLCNDLLSAYTELSDQMGRIGITSEFTSLVRQELDVEELLRTALEFLLAKTGPTNAAVFLPDTAGDYSLGAYVNYDCPKDSAETLFDHLSDVIAARFEDLPGVLTIEGTDELAEHLEHDAHWLADNTVVVFACRDEGETLAVVTLFRDERTPFEAPLLTMFGLIADAFGKQLGRVIRIHHRHLPRDQWDSIDGDIDEGDIDLAA